MGPMRISPTHVISPTDMIAFMQLSLNQNIVINFLTYLRFCFLSLFEHPKKDFYISFLRCRFFY